MPSVGHGKLVGTNLEIDFNFLVESPFLGSLEELVHFLRCDCDSRQVNRWNHRFLLTRNVVLVIWI